MNIVEALTAHHTVLRNLYRQAETNPQVFEEFIQNLVVHHTMEEKYFYDLLQRFDQGEHDALEAVNEHHIIEMIIKDAEGFPQEHEHFPIKIEGLGEYTVHHLDEEEADIFPLAAQLFSAEELITLGNLFEEAKARLLQITLPELPKALAAKFAEPVRTSSEASLSGTSARITDASIGLGIGKL